MCVTDDVPSTGVDLVTVILSYLIYKRVGVEDVSRE